MPSMTPIPTGEAQTVEVGGETYTLRRLTGRDTARAVRASAEVSRLTSEKKYAAVDDETLDAILAFFGKAFTEQDAKRIAYRFDDALGADQITYEDLFTAWNAVITILLGGDDADHPTNGSSDSPNGSTSTGPVSTDSLSGEEPTSPTSDSTDA